MRTINYFRLNDLLACISNIISNNISNVELFPYSFIISIFTVFTF